jgi:two-component system sensor histidine kinase AlgZ
MQFLLRGEKMVYGGQVRWSAFVWFTWALLAPFAIALIQRYPIERGRGMARAIAFNVLLTVGFVGLHAIVTAHIMVGVNLFGMASLGYSTQVVSLLAAQAHWGFLLYVGLVAMVHVVFYFQRAQVESLAREELRAQAASAQLMALSQQMQPHFLFNALNALVAMQDEGGAAQTFTIRLADMLRMLLHSGGRATATLSEELALVDAYLEIERARLGSRLRTDISIPAALAHCRLPAFTLQPLVENAITHSIARTPEGGQIQVRATRGAEEIAIDVSNSCNPEIAQPGAEEGMRLAIPNCRRRLLLMYGPEARVEAGFVSRNLFRASIILPDHAASRPPDRETGR